MAFSDFKRNLSQRIVVKPELLQMLELSDPRAQLDDVVEAEV
jgi:hypothetical protein